MRRPLTSLSATAIVGLLVMAMVLPGMAFGATKVKVAKNTTALEEGWYYRYRQPLEPVPQAPGETGDPLKTQQDNVEAQVRSRSNPYEAETLHVGVNATNPEARTFLYWDPFSLSDSGLATIIGGTVKLPLAEDARGVRNPESAKMIACLNIDLPTSDLAGEWKEQPKYDCKQSVPVKQVEGADPVTWTVNLDPFGKKWKKDPSKYAGIAIVEDPATTEEPQSSTWHVAFAGQFNETDAKKITADLKYEVEEFDFALPEVPTFDDPPAFEDTGGGFEEPADSGFEDPGFGEDNSMAAPGGGGFSAPAEPAPAPAPMDAPAAPAEESAEPALAAPAEEAAQPLAAEPASAPTPITNPFGYWLLPILGLALAGAVAWSLSHPVELVNVREGAVSRLMRARPGSA